MNKRRINAHIDGDLLSYVVYETDANSQTEAIDNALALMAWAIKEKKNGMNISSTDDGKTKVKEIVMPCLDRVKKN